MARAPVPHGVVFLRTGGQNTGCGVRASPIPSLRARRDAVPAGPHPAPPDHL